MTETKEETGIDVILDKWDLRTGADRFIFMEKSVNESDKVLILCNKVYILYARILVAFSNYFSC